jgi:hypothetical protein
MRGPTLHVSQPGSPVSAAETTSQRCPAGSATIASRTSRARRSATPRRAAAERAWASRVSSSSRVRLSSATVAILGSARPGVLAAGDSDSPG